MTPANSASASLPPGLRKWFFAMSERLYQSGRYNDRFGVTLSLPGIVGRGGVLRTFEPEMSREEQQALVLSAASLRKSLGRN
jgi:malate/lactate dehydrogenase